MAGYTSRHRRGALLALMCFFPVAVVPASALCRNTSPPSTAKAKTSTSSGGSPTLKPGSTSLPKCPISRESKARATAEKSGLLCHEGTAGQWFPLPAARLMLKDLKAGKAALSLQPKLEERIKLSDRRVKLLELDVATTDKIAGQWRQAAEVQAKQLAKADSVWRSPVLWFAVGLVIGVSGVTAAVVAK